MARAGWAGWAGWRRRNQREEIFLGVRGRGTRQGAGAGREGQARCARVSGWGRGRGRGRGAVSDRLLAQNPESPAVPTTDHEAPGRSVRTSRWARWRWRCLHLPLTRHGLARRALVGQCSLPLAPASTRTPPSTKLARSTLTHSLITRPSLFSHPLPPLHHHIPATKNPRLPHHHPNNTMPMRKFSLSRKSSTNDIRGVRGDTPPVARSTGAAAASVAASSHASSNGDADSAHGSGSMSNRSARRNSLFGWVCYCRKLHR